MQILLYFFKLIKITLLLLFLSSVISANIDLCGGVPHDGGTENLKRIFRQSD